MISLHDFEPIDGVQICKNCGLAVHPNGEWWFAGVKIKGKPLCDSTNNKNARLSFEEVLKKEFQEDMKKSEDLCKDIWCALANIIWGSEDTGYQYAASFRSAGGLISEIIGHGTYMDWYCCGPEEVVTDEIDERMLKHGWIPHSYPPF